MTFRERYCAAHGCPPGAFRGRLFWLCLHRHALPLAAVSGWSRERGYWAVDHELIANAGEVKSIRQLDEEIRDYVRDHRNSGWWRRTAHVRLSTRRLRGFAVHYLSLKEAAGTAKPGAMNLGGA